MLSNHFFPRETRLWSLVLSLKNASVACSKCKQIILIQTQTRNPNQPVRTVRFINQSNSSLKSERINLSLEVNKLLMICSHFYSFWPAICHIEPSFGGWDFKVHGKGSFEAFQYRRPELSSLVEQSTVWDFIDQSNNNFESVKVRSFKVISADQQQLKVIIVGCHSSQILTFVAKFNVVEVTFWRFPFLSFSSDCILNRNRYSMIAMLINSSKHLKQAKKLGKSCSVSRMFNVQYTKTLSKSATATKKNEQHIIHRLSAPSLLFHRSFSLSSKFYKEKLL